MSTNAKTKKATTTATSTALGATLLAALLACLLAAAELALVPTQEARADDAASTAMEIHAIFMPMGEKEAGDAVLMKSGTDFLLMDTGEGKSGAAKALIRYMESAISPDAYHSNYTLSLYISHHHPDHFNAYESVISSFKVSRVYLSHIEKEKYANSKIDARRKTGLKHRLSKYAKKEGKLKDPSFTYLSHNGKGGTATSFTFGSARADVVGAIGKYKEFSKKTGTSSTGAGRNNNSLIVMIEGGGVRYLTCGDIQENKNRHTKKGGEEIRLAKKYKGSRRVRADVMKLSHHGLQWTETRKRMCSNSKKLLSKVRPKVSFIMNGGLAPQEHKKERSSRSDVKHQLGEQSRRDASKYGFCYMLGYEKKSFKIICKDGKMELYRGSASDNMERMLGVTKIDVKSEKEVYNKKTKKKAPKIVTDHKFYFINDDGTRATKKWELIKTEGGYKYMRYFGKHGENTKLTKEKEKSG